MMQPTFKEKILKLKSENKTCKEIATILNCNRSSVYYHFNPECKIKRNETRNELRRKRKQFYVNQKGGKCSKCGYDKCIAALQFHHIDETTKEIEISAHQYSYNKILEELNKCILLCANCHAEIEYIRGLENS